MKPKFWLFCFAALMFWTLELPAQTNSAILESWFKAQVGLKTWSADAVQTRVLKTFSQPLVSTGKVWAIVPDRFRWEIGNPPQTIAIRKPTELILHYPRLKRAERYSLDEKQTGPWRDALALLDASFPKSRQDLESKFTITSVTETNGVAQISMEPRSGFARKFMSEIRVGFTARDFVPAFTELKFSDGSVMQNRFYNSKINEAVPQTLFEENLPAGTKVTEPGKQ